ncbi:unnamed protein product [Staurois parvus]|uniref:PHD-type domain-containing protein n=1 Tax=Staurois parvus TaxID=386267 RepID=A0ABN9AIR8_9NEOB|nr:unnamed protein product [Staurois parvus]
MKNDQQAKIPLKKRELKLTDDFDGPVKSSLCKSKTPTKELLQKDEEKLDDDSTKMSAAPAAVPEGKQLVNGEVNGDKSHKAKVDHVENSNTTPRESIISTAKEENGVVEKRTSSVIKSLHELKENSKPKIPENLEKSANDLSKDIIIPSSEESSPKTSLKEGSSVSETHKGSVDPKGGEGQKELLSSLEKKTAKTKKDCKKNTNDSESVKEAEVPKKPVIVATSDSPDDKKLSEPCASEDKKSRDSEKQDVDGSKEETASKTRDTKKKLSAKSKLASSRKASATAKKSTLSEEKPTESNKEAEEKCEPVSSDKVEEKEKLEEKEKPEEKEKQLKKPPETEKKTFSLRSKRREKQAAKVIEDASEMSESKEPEVKKTDSKDKISEKLSLLSRNKHRLEPMAEEDNSGSESKEMTSERQKDGIKLTIRISNKKRRPELPVESVPVDDAEDAENEDSIGRRLRRSPRISRPSIKVADVKERKPEKKQSDDEEEKPAPAKPAREEKKSEKEPCQKIKQKPKQKRRARWTNSRSRRKRKSSSEDESDESDSEEESEEESENEAKEEGVPGEDDEPCKKCGLPNHPELILLCDSCDSGYHTACLRPPLMLIPDGEWFCPPCQHKLLCEKLDEQLQNLDVVLKKKERAERRKERLVYVGISIENIIPTQEQEEVPEVQEKEEKKKKKSKPLERRSTRTRKFISYR